MVDMAFDRGVNFFDTANSYADELSEVYLRLPDEHSTVYTIRL